MQISASPLLLLPSLSSRQEARPPAFNTRCNMWRSKHTVQPSKRVNRDVHPYTGSSSQDTMMTLMAQRVPSVFREEPIPYSCFLCESHVFLIFVFNCWDLPAATLHPDQQIKVFQWIKLFINARTFDSMKEYQVRWKSLVTRNRDAWGTHV